MRKKAVKAESTPGSSIITITIVEGPGGGKADRIQAPQEAPNLLCHHIQTTLGTTSIIERASIISHLVVTTDDTLGVRVGVGVHQAEVLTTGGRRRRETD